MNKHEVKEEDVRELFSPEPGCSPPPGRQRKEAKREPQEDELPLMSALASRPQYTSTTTYGEMWSRARVDGEHLPKKTLRSCVDLSKSVSSVEIYLTAGRVPCKDRCAF